MQNGRHVNSWDHAMSCHDSLTTASHNEDVDRMLGKRLNDNTRKLLLTSVWRLKTWAVISSNQLIRTELYSPDPSVTCKLLLSSSLQSPTRDIPLILSIISFPFFSLLRFLVGFFSSLLLLFMSHITIVAMLRHLRGWYLSHRIQGLNLLWYWTLSQNNIASTFHRVNRKIIFPKLLGRCH